LPLKKLLKARPDSHGWAFSGKFKLEVNIIYKEIETGHLLKTNPGKAMEQKRDKAKQNNRCNG
jgi:hypothetical protein